MQLGDPNLGTMYHPPKAVLDYLEALNVVEFQTQLLRIAIQHGYNMSKEALLESKYYEGCRDIIFARHKAIEKAAALKPLTWRN